MHKLHLIQEEKHVSLTKGELLRDILDATALNGILKTPRESLYLTMLCKQMLISEVLYGNCGIDAGHSYSLSAKCNHMAVYATTKANSGLSSSMPQRRHVTQLTKYNIPK